MHDTTNGTGYLDEWPDTVPTPMRYVFIEDEIRIVPATHSGLEDYDQQIVVTCAEIESIIGEDEDDYTSFMDWLRQYAAPFDGAEYGSPDYSELLADLEAPGIKRTGALRKLHKMWLEAEYARHPARVDSPAELLFQALIKPRR